jgi:hypothetical protein
LCSLHLVVFVKVLICSRKIETFMHLWFLMGKNTRSLNLNFADFSLFFFFSRYCSFYWFFLEFFWSMLYVPLILFLYIFFWFFSHHSPPKKKEKIRVSKY